MSAGRRDAFTIPAERLPPGFAERVDAPPDEPAEPRPAATVVLIRDGAPGPEVLLLRRHRSSGFVPGAYVFPGGRVDAADAATEVLARATGMGSVPPAAFWVAAAREAFEETGALLGRTSGGSPVPAAASDPAVEAVREELLGERCTLLDALHTLDATLDLEAMVHFAHWITPIAEPRRYDTHFFLAALRTDVEIAVDPREMTDALWLTPADAMHRFHDGRLPMVFPTIRSVESLLGFPTTEAALAAFRGADVPTVLPRLVRRADGVTIEVDES